MTIDDIASRLNSKYIVDNFSTVRPTPVLLNSQEIVRLSEEAGLTRSAFYNEIALRIAFGFQDGTFDFSFCDQIANEIYAVITALDEDRPDLYWEVFLAFDAGEYHRNKDKSDDPVEDFTRPLIAEFLRKHNAPSN
jgi:hypothetical protein